MEELWICWNGPKCPSQGLGHIGGVGHMYVYNHHTIILGTYILLRTSTAGYGYHGTQLL